MAVDSVLRPRLLYGRSGPSSDKLRKHGCVCTVKQERAGTRKSTTSKTERVQLHCERKRNATASVWFATSRPLGQATGCSRIAMARWNMEGPAFLSRRDWPGVIGPHWSRRGTNEGLGRLPIGAASPGSLGLSNTVIRDPRPSVQPPSSMPRLGRFKVLSGHCPARIESLSAVH